MSMVRNMLQLQQIVVTTPAQAADRSASESDADNEKYTSKVDAESECRVSATKQDMIFLVENLRKLS